MGDKRQPVYPDCSRVPSWLYPPYQVISTVHRVTNRSFWITIMQGTNLRHEHALAFGLQLTAENAPPALKANRSERTVRIICQRYQSYLDWTASKGLTTFTADPETLARFIEDKEDSKGYRFNTVAPIYGPYPPFTRLSGSETRLATRQYGNASS